MKKSPARYVLAFLLLAGSIAGLIWYRQTSAPRPEPVAVTKPKVATPAPVAALPPPPPDVSDAPDVPPPPSPAEARQQIGQALQAFMSNPQVQQGMTAMTGAVTNAMYGDVFDQMNLTPDQLAVVNDVMNQRMQAANAVFLDALQQGVDPGANREQLQQQILQAQAASDQMLRATIGDDNFAQVQARDQQLRQTFQNGGGGFGGRGGG